MRTPWWKAFLRGIWKPCIWDTNSCGRINPRLIHLSITGFGRTGPKRAYHSCDSVQAAFGGQMHVSGIPTGKPLKLFGPQSCYAASLFGANAVLLGLRQRKITGLGRHIDLSIQEAVASTLDHVMIDYFQNRMTPGRPTDDPQPESFFTFPCKDGYIEIPLLRNGETILELVNSETNAAKKLGAEWKDAAYRNKHHRLFHDCGHRMDRASHQTGTVSTWPGDGFSLGARGIARGSAPEPAAESAPIFCAHRTRRQTPLPFGARTAI